MAQNPKGYAYREHEITPGSHTFGSRKENGYYITDTSHLNRRPPSIWVGRDPVKGPDGNKTVKTVPPNKAQEVLGYLHGLVNAPNYGGNNTLDEHGTMIFGNPNESLVPLQDLIKVPIISQSPYSHKK